MTKKTRQDELLDELLAEYSGPESFWGESGLFATLKKRIVERTLEAEMDHHLGYTKHDPKGNNSGNSRNGRGKKTVMLGDDQVELDPPRDRNGSFEPQIIPKGQKYFKGFDDRIIAMYGRGMSVRDIQGHLLEMYQVDVSEGLISQATNSVMEEVRLWQGRPLEKVYPIVFLDCLMIKGRPNGPVENRCVYLALGINVEGKKELLGIWIAKNEGAKFWLGVLNELRNRGVEDIFIACIDGLKGFPEAIEAVYPQTTVQLCIVHMIRNSLRFVSYKNRKDICADLKEIYNAASEALALEALDRFAAKWDGTYPTISKSWRDNWVNIVPFLDYPPEIRKIIYTTNAIESLNRSIRKVTKTKGIFPNDDSIVKILFLALRNIAKKWTSVQPGWKAAMNQFAIRYGDRLKLN